MSGTIAMTLSEASMKIVRFLVLPVMTFYLSPRDFGIIASIKMVQGFLILLYNPGMLSGITRIYFDTEDEAKRKEYIGSGLLFFLIVSISISSVMVLLGDSFFKRIFNEFELYPYGIIAIILSVLIQPKRLWSSLLTFRYKVTKIALYSFIEMMIDIGISLFLIAVLLWGVDGRIIGMYSGLFFIFVVAMLTLLRYIRGHYSIKTSWKLFVFGLPLAPAIWAYSALEIADRFLIEHFIGLEKLGIYSIGYTISSVPLFLSLGFRKMWNPVFYENMNDKQYNRVNVLIKYYALGMALVTGVLIMFSQELVTIALAKSFAGAKEIVPFVCSGIFFLGILPISSSFITFANKFSRISLNAGISAVVNIVLNLILLPRIGVVGAAVATLVAYVVYFVLNALSVSGLFSRVVSIGNLIVPVSFIVVATTVFYAIGTSLLYFFIKAGIVALFLGVIILSGYLKRDELLFLKKVVFRLKSS